MGSPDQSKGIRLDKRPGNGYRLGETDVEVALERCSVRRWAVLRATRTIILMPGLCLVLSLAAAARAGGPFDLQRANGDLYLVLGTKRMPYHDPGNSNEQLTQVQLPDGATVTLAPRGQITVAASGREVGSIAFQDVARQLLDQESLWGGHKEANDLRYLLRAGTEGDLTAISDLTPVGDTVLAVLTWRTGGSGFHIAAQYLVRIEASPQPALVPLLRLPLPYITDDAYLARPPGPRLFRAGERLLVHTRPTTIMNDPGYKAGAPAELTEIDPTGRAVGIFATAPASLLPQGILAERWLVLLDRDSQAQEPVWLLDLTTRTLRPLPGDWRSVQYGETRAFIPSTGSRILVSRSVSTEPDGSGRYEQTFIVHIPSGERELLPGASIGRIWEGYVIARDGRGTSIYSAETGKLVQQVQTD